MPPGAFRHVQTGSILAAAQARLPTNPAIIASAIEQAVAVVTMGEEAVFDLGFFDQAEDDEENLDKGVAKMFKSFPLGSERSQGRRVFNFYCYRRG